MSRLSFALVLWLFVVHLPYSLSSPGGIIDRDDVAPSGPQVKSNGATFIGVTDDNYGVSIWRGIRYAKPPTGSLRLQPPQKVDNDVGIRVLYNFAQFAQNLSLPRFFGDTDGPAFGEAGELKTVHFSPIDAPVNVNNSEDCLFLDIYKPSQAALKSVGYDSHDHGNAGGSDGLPVMFWIHGGGFNDGSGQIYDSRSLVNTSVALKIPTIVITINYRLNFFGFSAGKEVTDNNGLNLGLLDQRIALQWVHDHIKSFGGNPEKVTIFGQSAGATSVGLHITAYDGKHQDLFRAAILESGSPQDTAPTPPSNWPPYQTAWDTVVADVGCSNSANVFACVQGIPEAQLFPAIQTAAQVLAPLPVNPFPWQPVIDGTFLTDFPTKLLAAGKFVKLPTIIGFTTDDGTYIIPTTLNISTDTILAGLAQVILPFVPTTIIQQLLLLDPLSAFPNPYAVGGVDWKRAGEIAADIFERCPGRAFIRNMTDHAPTWKYRWNAALPVQTFLAPEQGIAHAADVPYVFGPSISPYVNAPLDIALSQTVQKAYLSFAAHLSPNRLGDLEPGVRWPRYDKDAQKVLVFQKTDGSGEFPNGGFGVPVGQGLHVERDSDDRPVCDFIVAEDAAFIH